MNRSAAPIPALPLLTLGCDLETWIKRAKSERRSAETHESDGRDEPSRRSKRKATAQAPEPTISLSAFPATELPPPVNYLATPPPRRSGHIRYSATGKVLRVYN